MLPVEQNVEVRIPMAIVGLFNMTNALANGYQVKPDVRPKLD